MKLFRKIKMVEKVEKPERKVMAIDKNSTFVYTGGADVMKTFRRYGFTPPSETRTDFLFAKNRENCNG